MTHFRSFRKATLELLDAQAKSPSALSTKERVEGLVRLAQNFSRAEHEAHRDGAIRVTGDAMYVRGNVGPYTSEAEGRKAIERIERLKKK